MCIHVAAYWSALDETKSIGGTQCRWKVVLVGGKSCRWISISVKSRVFGAQYRSNVTLVECIFQTRVFVNILFTDALRTTENLSDA